MRAITNPHRVFLVSGGIVCLALLTLINVQGWAVHVATQSLLLYAGIAGMVILPSPPTPLPQGKGRQRAQLNSAVEFGWWFNKIHPLVVILLMALVVRLVGLDSIVSLYVDELYPASQVTRLRENAFTLILTPMDEPLPFTWVYVSWQYVSTLVFGANLFALRVVSALVGTLTVWATYGLAQVWFGRGVALLTALLLATFPPHIHLSRLGIINVPDALFGVLALWLLSRAWQGGREWALAGAALGATAYFHEGGRLLYPALIALWLLTCIGGWRTRWRGLVTFAGCALVVAAPVMITLAASGQALSPRLADAGVTGEFWWALLTSPLQDGLWTIYLRDMLTPALLHYVSTYDSSVIYYGGQTALVLPYLVPFFLMGIVVLLLRIHQPAARLLLLWLIGTAIGNSLLGFTVNRYTARFLVAFPAIAMVVGMGMVYLTPRPLSVNRERVSEEHGEGEDNVTPPRLSLHCNGEGEKSSQKQRLIRWIVPLVALMLAMGQVVYYFAIHLPEYNQQIRSVPDEVDVIQRSAALPDGTQAYLITDVPYYRGAFDILPRYWGVEMALTTLTPADVTDAWLDALPAPPLAFFIAPQDIATLALLQARYPQLSPAIASPYHVPMDKQYALYRVVLE